MLDKSEADLWAWFRDGMHKELHDLEKRRHLIQARATSWILATAAFVVVAYVFPPLLQIPRQVFVPLGVALTIVALFKKDRTVELVSAGLGLIFWSLWADYQSHLPEDLTHTWLDRLVPGGTLLPALLTSGVGLIDVKNRMREFRADFKGRVIRALVGFVDENWTFTPNGKISGTDVDASGLVPDNISKILGEDLVEGSIGHTAFSMSEICAQRRETFRDKYGMKHEYMVDVFNGFMFVCNYNRYFPHEVFVFPDTAERFLGFMGTRLQEMNRSHGELVKLEDPVFEKYFAVYGSDQIATRMVLPPSIMEEMVAFREKSGTPVSMSIRQGRFFAAVPLSRDLFEPPLFRPITRFSELRELFDDLTLFVDLARAIDLNTRRWSETSGLSEMG